MKQKQAIEFLDNNPALELLMKKIRLADTVRQGQYSDVPEESRRIAIELVESWITEIFELKEGDLASLAEEEESIYKRLSES